MKMKVMVAVDESDCSFHALKWALENVLSSVSVGATSTSTADPDENNNEGEGMVFLLHVEPVFHHPVYPIGHTAAAFYPVSVLDESVKKAQHEKSASILAKALQMCRDTQIKAESVILNGDPREMICEAAEQMRVDLLIMGSRGLGMLKRTFLGSVSDYCAHHAKTPILIVKPPQDDHKNK